MRNQHSMSEIVATTPGLYPLPDDAKRRLSELKGHQKGDLIGGDEGAAVREAYATARETVLAEQAAAGLELVTEGQLRWDDMLAHPAIVADGVEPGGIVRYYDNNNFYRDPRVVSELEPTGDVADELAAAADLWDAELTRPAGFDDAGESVTLDGSPGDRLQATLPGPYTLSRLVTDDHYGDEAALLGAVGDFLAGEVERFPEHATLTLWEPSLVTDPPGDGTDERAADAVDRVARATDAPVVVGTAWAAFEEKPYAHLLDAAIDAVGFDFVNGARDRTLYCINEYGTTDDVALGVTDAQNTRVEDPETIADRAEWVHDQTHGSFDRTYLTHTTGAFFLPVNRHREKLAALAEGAEIARARFDGRDADDADGADDATETDTEVEA